MRGSSADSLARLTGSLDQALESGADGDTVGDDLIAAARVLREQVALRRAATDPSSPTEAKSGLLRGVFGSHLSAEATDLVAEAGGLRWATSTDLVASLERLGVIAVVKSADKAGDGDRLEDELFSFGQTVAHHPGLRDALSDPARSVADKQALIRSLLERQGDLRDGPARRPVGVRIPPDRGPGAGGVLPGCRRRAQAPGGHGAVRQAAVRQRAGAALRRTRP